MTRISSPTDRRPGFLNSAPTFDVRQLSIGILSRIESLTVEQNSKSIW